MHLSYVCLPFRSHLDWGGVYELFECLCSKGIRVTVLSGHSIKPYLPNEVEFIDIGLGEGEHKRENETIQECLVRHREEIFFDVNKFLIGYNKLIDFFRVDRPGLVLCDSACKSGIYACRNLNLRYKVVCPEERYSPSFLGQLDGELHDKWSSAVKHKVSIDEHTIFEYPINHYSPFGNIHFTTPEFWGVSYWKEEFYGASKLGIDLRTNESIRESVYISCGTLFYSKSQIEDILDVISFMKLPFKFSNTFDGNTSFTGLGIENYNADEKVILSESKFAIIQGGLGTTINCIRHGIPVIIWPLIPANLRQARSIHSLKSGIMVENKSQLKKAVQDLILNYGEYRRNALRLMESFDSLGGVYRLSQEIYQELLCSSD